MFHGERTELSNMVHFLADSGYTGPIRLEIQLDELLGDKLKRFAGSREVMNYVLSARDMIMKAYGA